MDKLGAVVGSLTTQSHLQRRDEAGLIGPITNGADLPALFIRHVDRDISDQVAWSWKGTGEHGPHSPTLRRALNENELATINSRMFDLQRACAAYTDDEQAALAEIINKMLLGFPQLRTLDRKQALAMVVSYLRNSKELPPWAIVAACENVSKDRAYINAAYPPTEAQLYSVADELVAPYRERIAKLKELLDAPVDPPQPIAALTREEVQERLGRKIDDNAPIVPPTSEHAKPIDKKKPQRKWRR